jgi:hypothetical protein
MIPNGRKFGRPVTVDLDLPDDMQQLLDSV